MKKFSLSTFNKFFLATLGLLVITGCSTMPPVYDELPSMPEYKPSEKQYDKSAVIRFKPSDNAAVDKMIKEMFISNEYVNLSLKENFFREIPESLKIVKVLDVHNQIFKQADGNHIESRIIVMVRKPGYVINGQLDLAKCNVRVFQAYGRFRTKKLTSAAYKKANRMAVENLFTMDEFLSALEPEKNDKPKQLVQWIPNLSADACWKNSIAAKNNGNEYEAIFWAYNAAELGNAAAIKFCIAQAKSGNLSRDIAAKYIKKLAAKGDPWAQYTLASTLKKSNMQESFTWMTRAANQNYIPALLNLGFMYEYGSGVAKNMEYALEYYRKAADLGNSFAKRKVRELTAPRSKNTR